MSEKLSFYSMMEKLYEAENELIAITDEEIKELLGDLKGKVDGMKDWIDKLDSEAVRLGVLVKQFQGKKKAVENAKDRFKKYIGQTMISNETPVLFGATYNISSKNQTFTKIKKNIDISTLDYAAFKEMGIEREYKINSTVLKNAVKKEGAPEGLSKFIEVETKPVVRFSIRKGN